MASQYLGQQVDRDGLGMVDVLPTLLVLLYGTKRDPPRPSRASSMTCWRRHSTRTTAEWVHLLLQGDNLPVIALCRWTASSGFVVRWALHVAYGML